MRGMKRRTAIKSISAVAIAPLIANSSDLRAEESTETVYELRVYHAAAGKLQELLARFRNHTIELFGRHEMKLVAFWTLTDEPDKANMLVYILRHPSREAARANWKSFQDDPEWKAVKAKSEEKGSLVDKVDSTYMQLTDFSPRLK
jgi:hypothetical protein